MAVQQLKDAVLGVAEGARTSGETLNKLEHTLSGRGEKVQRKLQGTGHGADAQVAASVGAALEAVKEATQAMNQAQQSAEDYAAQL